VSEEFVYGVLAIAAVMSAIALVAALPATIFDFVRFARERRDAVRRANPQASYEMLLLMVASILAVEIVVLQSFAQNGAPIALRSVAGLVFAVGLWQIYQKQSRRVRTPAIAELISIYYSAYLSRPVVVEALKETATALNHARLVRALGVCVNAFYSGCTLEESLDQLEQHIEHPLCAQFVSILKGASSQSAVAMTESLRLLKERAEHARTF
jgi:uncharacterized oligopeptide transporter (OPT) family protein